MLRWFIAAFAAVAMACGSGGESGVPQPGPDTPPAPQPDPETPPAPQPGPGTSEPESGPVITVESPAPLALARPVVTVSATCTSGGKECASFTLSVSRAHAGHLLTGTGSLSGDVDLSAYEGYLAELVFSGVDAANRQAAVRRIVYVESSTNLSVVATVPGPIWDYSDRRVLYVDVTGCSSVFDPAGCSTPPVLRIRDTTTGAAEDVEASVDVLGTWGCYGYLTSSGAIYAHGHQSNETYPFCWAHEWRSGANVDLGGLNSCESLRIAGPYALYSTQPDVDGPQTLVRRDLRTGANTPISTGAGNWMNDVAASGDVVYWGDDYNVYRWREGVSTLLTDDAPMFWNTYPVTDGVNVVYRKTNPTAWTLALVLDDGHGAVELHPAEPYDPSPGKDYAIANGLVAYTREGGTQVWRHSSTAEELVASFGTPCAIDGIAPDGTVVLTSASRRYRAVPGMPLQDIGSALGWIVYRAGAFYDIVGGTVLEVER